jgi:flagellum-specific peptidoglycan hydrolase FlgJ
MPPKIQTQSPPADWLKTHPQDPSSNSQLPQNQLRSPGYSPETIRKRQKLAKWLLAATVVLVPASASGLLDSAVSAMSVAPTEASPLSPPKATFAEGTAVVESSAPKVVPAAEHTQQLIAEATLPTLSPEQNQKIDSYTKLRPDQRDFLKQVIRGTNGLAEDAGVSRPVVAAQAILETGWGTSAPHYNYFGIKAGDWTGPTYTTPTMEADATGRLHPVNDVFRAYNSSEEAFKDYARVITSQPWFTDASSHADNWQEYLHGLQHEPNEDQILAANPNAEIKRYATAHDYEQVISDIVNTYDLDTLTSV